MTRALFPILYARDLAGLVEFYREAFGMNVGYRFPPEGEAAFVTLRHGRGELGIGTYEPTPGLEGRPLDQPAAGRGFELCVSVPDVDAAAQAAERGGAPVLVRPADQPWGERVAYVRDPEGNTVMLCAPVTVAAGVQAATARGPEKVNLAEKLALFDVRWSPKAVAAVNDFHVKLVKLEGEFVWHSHDVEDELFLVLKGELRMQFRDREVVTGPGEFIVVPHGVEHRPVADGEVHVLLLEPATTVNTGTAGGERTRDVEWL